MCNAFNTFLFCYFNTKCGVPPRSYCVVAQSGHELEKWDGKTSHSRFILPLFCYLTMKIILLWEVVQLWLYFDVFQVANITNRRQSNWWKIGNFFSFTLSFRHFGILQSVFGQRSCPMFANFICTQKNGNKFLSFKWTVVLAWVRNQLTIHMCMQLINTLNTHISFFSFWHRWLVKLARIWTLTNTEYEPKDDFHLCIQTRHEKFTDSIRNFAFGNECRRCANILMFQTMFLLVVVCTCDLWLDFSQIHFVQISRNWTIRISN